MEISKYLRDYSRTIAGKEQMIISSFARSFEIIPRQLCENAGFDSTDILNKLRKKHTEGGLWYGVDINNEDIADNYEATVWEPAVVKINSLTAATEAASLILSIDETIKAPKSTSEGATAAQAYPGGGRGMGRPM
jgi:T-complex protein 1 subunit eta